MSIPSSTPRIRIVHRLAEVDLSSWNALASQAGPFLQWEWLTSLEEAGCVTAQTGWAPHHILLDEAGQLVGACPLYLKGHSEGEFVFDHQWAAAAQQAGISYYPKLLVAIPFTPANGVRLLTSPQQPAKPLLRLLAQALIALCEQNQLSSIHVNFCTETEAEVLGELGFLKRVGVQYHWKNQAYGQFKDYLESFRSKRRNQIRRERKVMKAHDIRIWVEQGQSIAPNRAKLMYDLYRHHIRKMFWGRLYLTEAFFEKIIQHFAKHVHLVLAQRDDQIVAGTFNIAGDGVFYGRYWGGFEEIPMLHFNVCYYSAIEHCIAQGLHTFQPGAGGDFKRLRGFDPQPTYSMHYLAEPRLQAALQTYLAHEREHMHHTIHALTQRSQLKKTK